MRIIVLFNLKEGVQLAEYEEWAKTRDIPGVNALGSIDGLTVHTATGMFGAPDATPPYQYFEIIDVNDMDAFLADISTPEFQAVAAPFRDYADSPQFVLTEDL